MTSQTRTSHSPPDWLIIVALMLPYIALGSVISVMGVFFKPLQAEFGWSRTVTSSGYTALIACYGISNVVMGRVLDRYGFRLVLLLAAFLTGGGVILLSLVQGVNQFRFLMLMVGLGMGGCFVVSVTMAQLWFRQRRGHVLGIISSGFGLGAVVFAPLLNHFIYSTGWRQSYLILGLYISVSLLVSNLILKRGVDRVETRQSESADGNVSIDQQDWTAHQILRMRPYILILGSFCLGAIGLMMVSVHLVPYAVDSGISETSAAFALGLLGGIMIPARLNIGFLQRRLGWR